MGSTSSDPTCRSTTPTHLSLYRTYSEIYRLEMRFLVLSLMVTVASAGPQIAFGAPKESSSTTKAPANVNTRLGLLAGSLGLDPLAGTGGSTSSGSSGSSGVSQAFTDGQNQPTGRAPQQCCCVPFQEQ